MTRSTSDSVLPSPGSVTEPVLLPGFNDSLVLYTPRVLMADGWAPELGRSQAWSHNALVLAVGAFLFCLAMSSKFIGGYLGLNLEVSDLGIVWFVLLLLFSSVLQNVRQRRKVRYHSSGAGVDSVRRRVERFAEQHPQWSMRLYALPYGVRVIVTHAEFDPADNAVKELCKAIGAWPTYAADCALNQRFAVLVCSNESAYRDFQHRLLAEFGATPVHPAVVPTVNLHDRAVGLPTSALLI
ncbi:hypothetical protein SDC9_96142 [bioreactor metagenome]|uniref:Uncharacterized protein n=1 Tax=bioreactor metagenome TaxID=1076179 RepID=A0A645AEZ6_9ZZZZ